jgi:hypothetical protein
MKNVLLLISLLFTSNLAWSAAPLCTEIFDENYDPYITQTAEQSRIKVIAQTIFTGATALQFGTPTMLRGIPMKGVFWMRDGHILSGMKRAYAEGTSPWGKTSLFTQSGRANTLSITIEPNLGASPLTNRRLEILKNVFPALKIATEGSTVMRMGEDEVVPERYHLQLDRSELGPEDNYETISRSLINTLFNDPNGLLRLRSWEK